MLVYAVAASLAWGFALVIDRDWPGIRLLSFAAAVLLTFLTLNAIL